MLASIGQSWFIRFDEILTLGEFNFEPPKDVFGNLKDYMYFWVLDDLGALQNKSSYSEAIEIVTPKDTYRIFGGNSKAVGQGQNPRSGVTFDY